MNDAATTAGPTNWKRPALLLLVVVAILVAIAGLVLPKKPVTGRHSPAPTEHRQHAPGYSNSKQ